MEQIISHLQSIIQEYAPRLEKLNEEMFSLKPLPGKWSKKEMLGHLIDSAQNNIRRFVVAQYEDDPQIVYAQDFWVTAAGYQKYLLSDLVQLWVLINKHICIVLKNIPAGSEQRTCVTKEKHTIEWLAADYNQHLLHHLHQVLDLEPVEYS
ncbi:MAG: DinB family protein [Chitinophagaceae bacterium]|nr:DinB family protein [Chitinophagaceae bacterium]